MLGISTILALFSAEGAFADGLPGSSDRSTVTTAPVVPAALTPTPAITSAASPTAAPDPSVSPLSLVVVVPIAGTIPLPVNPLPPFSATPAPQPLTDGLTQLSTGVKGALDQIGTGMAGTPLAPLASSGAAAGVATVVTQAVPLATLCVQPNGRGTALANIDLLARGGDIGTPLVQTFPGFLAPCPTGMVPVLGTDPTTIVSVTLNQGTLLGACVRITPSVVPVRATILILTQNLIQQLTAAGLPLRQLIVPCPSTTQAVASAIPAVAGDASAAVGRLPFTGAQIALLLAMAAALIGAGTVMVRKARGNQWAVSI